MTNKRHASFDESPFELRDKRVLKRLKLEDFARMKARKGGKAQGSLAPTNIQQPTVVRKPLLPGIPTPILPRVVTTELPKESDFPPPIRRVLWPNGRVFPIPRRKTAPAGMKAEPTFEQYVQYAGSVFERNAMRQIIYCSEPYGGWGISSQDVDTGRVRVDGPCDDAPRRYIYVPPKVDVKKAAQESLSKQDISNGNKQKYDAVLSGETSVKTSARNTRKRGSSDEDQPATVVVKKRLTLEYFRRLKASSTTEESVRTSLSGSTVYHSTPSSRSSPQVDEEETVKKDHSKDNLEEVQNRGAEVPFQREIAALLSMEADTESEYEEAETKADEPLHHNNNDKAKQVSAEASTGGGATINDDEDEVDEEDFSTTSENSDTGAADFIPFGGPDDNDEEVMTTLMEDIESNSGDADDELSASDDDDEFMTDVDNELSASEDEDEFMVDAENELSASEDEDELIADLIFGDLSDEQAKKTFLKAIRVDHKEGGLESYWMSDEDTEVEQVEVIEQSESHSHAGVKVVETVEGARDEGDFLQAPASPLFQSITQRIADYALQKSIVTQQVYLAGMKRKRDAEEELSTTKKNKLRAH